MRWGLNFIGNQDCNWSPADKRGSLPVFFSSPPPPSLHFSSLPFSYSPLPAFCLVIPPWLCGRTGAVQSGAVQSGEEREKKTEKEREGGGGEGEGEGGRDEMETEEGRNIGYEERWWEGEWRIEGKERGGEEAQGQCEDSVVLGVGQRDSRSHLCANQPFGGGWWGVS